MAAENRGSKVLIYFFRVNLASLQQCPKRTVDHLTLHVQIHQDFSLNLAEKVVHSIYCYWESFFFLHLEDESFKEEQCFYFSIFFLYGILPQNTKYMKNSRLSAN